ncbi:MAG: hypothetical protein NZL93_04165, partial [Chthoniobacterales bacterium]|nr:hypothetical protein [Chthoniobacterales bacterium]
MKTQRTFAPLPLRFFLIVVLLLAFLPPSHTEPTNNQPTPTTSGPASLPTPSETLNPSEDLEVTFLEKKIWSLFDSRTFRARFEKYLNSPPANSAEDQKYHSTISQITLLLTPGKVNKANLDKSLELLQIASAYPGDSNLCQTLFEAIHSIRQQNLETEKLKNELRELEKERSKAEWNMQMASRQTSLSIPGGDSPAAKIAAEQAQREQTTRIQQAQKRLDEVNQTITNRKSKITINEFLAKSQLQSLAVQFFATRRFQHCILANRYYRALFSDGDNSL